MAFTSSCPKCQKQVLVPEGVSHDAVVQCPLCSGEYSLGEILAGAPPALIIVHAGSAAATVPVAAGVLMGAGAISHSQFASESANGGVFSAHPAEPDLHAEPLLFEGDKVHLMPDGQHDSEHAAEGILFAPGAEGADAMNPFAEPAAVPLLDAGHNPGGEPGQAGAPWGGNWGGFKDESANGEDGTVGLAESDQDEGLANVDFADITGKPAPGSALAAGDAAAEPGKKKKRKRERNPIVFFIMIVVSGLLAVPCALCIAALAGQKLDFLPTWLQFNFVRTTNSKPTSQTSVPANTQPVANTNPTPAAVPAGSDTGKTAQPSTDGSGQATTEKPPADSKSPAVKQPSEEHDVASAGDGKTDTTPAKSATGPGAGVGLAMNDPNKKGPAAEPNKAETKPDGTNGSKPDAKPAVAVPAKPDGPGEPDPFGGPLAAMPGNEKSKPEVTPEAKPETPAVKPDSAPSEPDPFGTLPPVAPVNGKNKPESMPETKPATEPAKPDVPGTVKPEIPVEPEPDPFGGPSAVAPAKEKSKPETKPENTKPENSAKPDATIPAKPNAPPPVKPDASTKPETPGSEPDPFGSPSVPPAETEKSKPDANASAKPDTKPDVPPLGKPEMPAKSDKPQIGGATPPKPDRVKPDVVNPDAPVIGPKPEMKPEPRPEVKPEPTPEVKPELKPKPEIKPDVKPELKPDVKPAVKPAGVGPLQAPSFAAADLDASLKAVSAGAAIDAKSYADWCKLAEVVTYVNDGAESQKQALKAVTEKVAASPQAAAAIAASAKKLLDDKATKGGIVLAGAVTGLATRNGISGTVIRMEGMEKPVRVFSARPLDVKEGQKVIVFGALVADPAKNIPGYKGTQPVVVWADFAAVVP
jgi:hypothetical protein